jgi:hypothetical protein
LFIADKRSLNFFVRIVILFALESKGSVHCGDASGKSAFPVILLGIGNIGRYGDNEFN